MTPMKRAMWNWNNDKISGVMSVVPHEDTDIVDDVARGWGSLVGVTLLAQHRNQPGGKFFV